MPSESFELELGRDTVAVWVGMLLIGTGAWFGSGTPFAGAAIVAAVLLAMASPQGALYATCAAIPLVFHPIHVGSLQLGLLEIGILATALGTGFRLGYDLVQGGDVSLRVALSPAAMLVLPIGLLTIGTLSLVWMPFDLHRAEALRTWRWVIVEPVILFGLARLAIVKEGHAPLAIAVSGPAVVVASGALWQLVDLSSAFSVDNVHRSTATYLHPNNLALYLERVLFLALVPGLLLSGKRRWLLLGMSCMIAAGIGATFSRGALLGIATGFAVLLLAHPVRHGWRVLALGTAVVTIGFGAVATHRLTGSNSSGIIATRRYLWSDSLRMLRDFPISGIGLDQFLWLHQRRYIDPRIWSERYVSHPHNLLLDSWLSLGLGGVLLLLLFLTVGGWVVYRARSGKARLDVWQLGALACLGAGLGHALVDNGYFLPDLAALTWLAIAIAAPMRSSVVRSTTGFAHV